MSAPSPWRTRARSAAVVIVAWLFLSASHLVQAHLVEDRSHWPAEYEYVILPPPEAAPLMFSWMGRETAADIIWVRALVYYGSQRIGVSDFRYLTLFLDNIIALDPKWKKIYTWAGAAVTFKAERATQEEFELSAKYLEKGVLAFPDDWELHRTLGLRYWLDLVEGDEETRRKLKERGSVLIEKAMRIPGAPVDLTTLAASLRTQLGQRERALTELRQMILATDSKKTQATLLARYRALSESPAPAQELEEYKRDFEAAREATLPYAPPVLFMIIGSPPSPRIDLAAVAPVRDLFGQEELDETEAVDE